MISPFYNTGRKLIVLLSALLTALLISFPTAKADDTDWTGYIPVSSKEELNNARDDLSGKYYLTADIVFTAQDFMTGGAFYNDGEGWLPIGSRSTGAFTGTFDGNGHSISGLYCNISAEVIEAGLFGYNKGTIQNLGMIDSDIRATAFLNGSYAGGIVGDNEGIIRNCDNIGKIVGTYYDVGGIAGCNRNIISNCYNTGDVKSSGDSAGGVAGVNDAGTIDNSYNAGNVYGDFSAGGIVGYATGGNGYHSNIRNCYNLGIVLGGTPKGIVGKDIYTANIENCYYLDIGSGEDSSGTALTPDKMKDPASFAGFDFTDVWTIQTDGEYPFPALKSVPLLAKPENTAVFDGGNGTVLNPYRISGKGQLDQVRNYPTSCFITTSDITFLPGDFAQGGAFYNNGAGWSPIGPNDADAFCGMFDGGGHIVSGLYCNVTSGSNVNVGLFGYNKGTIQNLEVADSIYRVAATSSNWCHTGGIAGSNHGNIRDSSFSGNIATKSGTSLNDLSGGIAGLNYGVITGCHNEGSVKSERDGGGIAGFIGNNGVVSDCYNTGYISGRLAGGIVGSIDTSTGATNVIDCYNLGSVDASYAGGVVGELRYGKMSNCYNAGNIHGGSAGGIVYINAGEIANCYNTGNVSGLGDAGGIAGDNAMPMSNCYNTGTINSTANPPRAGGIAGRERKSASMSGCYFLDTITTGIGVLETGATNPTIKLTADQMKQQASYSGFDFENVWQREEGTWPYLRVFSYHPLTGLEFEPDGIRVTTGGTYQTKLRLIPENVSFANIVYTSNADDGKITITNGIVTGITAGTAYAVAKDTITNTSAICEVTVAQGVTGITISGSANTVFAGDDLQLSAEVAPANADNKTVSWSSSDNGIASVDQNGLVHAISLGTVTICATSTDGTNIKGSYSLTVYQPVQSVSLNVSEIQLKNGETQTLTATVLPADATNKSVAWTSSDTAVATVDTTGKVTAKSRGTAVINCKTTDGGFEASCAVTVIQQVTGVTLAKQTINMGLGGQLQLVPIIIPANANNQSVTWKSSHPEYVTVSDDGLITGVGTGDGYGISLITVTTQDGSKTADCIVTVGKAVASISLNKTQATLIEGTTEALSVNTILPADAFNKEILWKSSDEFIASVDTNGNVTAKKAGTAVISAEATDGSGIAAICDVTVTIRTVFNINATSNNPAYGTVSGAGNYQAGATATMKAVPKANYRFVQWLEGTNAVSTDAEYRFTVSADRSLKAEFAAIATPSVVAASSGYNSIKLTWAAVAGAKDYEVSRATSSTGTYTVLGTATALSYTSTGLTTNTTYYYKVRARCVTATATTYGPCSAVKSAKPIPAAVGSLVAVSSSYNSIRVSWGAVSGATKYEVYRAASSTGSYTLLTATSYTYYTNTGVNTGTAYYYKVRAYRLVGSTKVYGAYSSVASARTMLGTPSPVRAAPVTYNSIKVTWGAVAGASGYVVYRATSSTGSYTSVGSTTSTSFTNTGAGTGINYYYKVRAYRVVGGAKVYGTYSAAASAKTAIGAPASVKATRASSSSVKAAWSAVSGATRYELWRSTSSGGTYTLVAVTASLYYTNGSLTTGRTYYYKVRAYHLEGSAKVYGPFSIVVYAKP